MCGYKLQFSSLAPWLVAPQSPHSFLSIYLSSLKELGIGQSFFLHPGKFLREVFYLFFVCFCRLSQIFDKFWTNKLYIHACLLL